MTASTARESLRSFAHLTADSVLHPPWSKLGSTCIERPLVQRRCMGTLLMCILQGSLGVPLPCGPLGVRKGTVYDLHAAHVNSGATDTEQVALPFNILNTCQDGWCCTDHHHELVTAAQMHQCQLVILMSTNECCCDTYKAWCMPVDVTRPVSTSGWLCSFCLQHCCVGLG